MKCTSKHRCNSLSLCGVLLLTSLALATPAYADEVQDLDGQVERLDKASKEAGGAKPDLESISKATGVPVAELERQRSKTKMGTGSLLIANSLATKTGQSFDDIMAAKASGKGWGQIAKANNVKLGPLLKEAKQVGRAQAQSTSGKTKGAISQSDGGRAAATSAPKGGQGDGPSVKKKSEATGGDPGNGGRKGKR